jgi:hypothetical protein
MELAALHDALRQDPAMRLYYASVGSRRRNRGIVGKASARASINAIRRFLQFLNRPITTTAVSDLIAETRERHRRDDFAIDNAILQFVSTPPAITHSGYGAWVKGIFKANRTPLQASFNTCFTHSTKKISPGILQAIYLAATLEQRDLMDLQAYAGERITCLASLVTLDQWEDCGKYVLIHIESSQTKARYEHVSIIPKVLADRIRERAKAAGRSRAFPNHDSIWREITTLALAKFGVRMTSHYLRKRFHTIAGKTTMPVNSWDYLMGDKQSLGHNAGTYTLEDFADLIAEYDRFLAPYLSIGEPKEPDEPRAPIQGSPKANELELLRRQNDELKAQIIENNRIMQKLLAKLG